MSNVIDLDEAREARSLEGAIAGRFPRLDPTPKPLGFLPPETTDEERNCINWKLSGAVRRARAPRMPTP